MAKLKTVTIFGRVSYPALTMKEALASNERLDNPLPTDQVAPGLEVLVEQNQLDKFLKYIEDEFKPFTMSDDARTKLTQKDWDRLQKVIEDPEVQPPYIPIKPVNEKTQELAPEVVAAIRCKGNKGVDLQQVAVVGRDEDLVVVDPDKLNYPRVEPIGLTHFSIYAGCRVGVTINPYAFKSGGVPGFSAGISAVVFKADDEKFGGGVAYDDDIFLDD